MNFKKISFLLLGVVLISGMTDLIAQNKSKKPRVIAMTDGEIDDRFMWGAGHIGYGADNIKVHNNISIQNAGFLEPEYSSGTY